MNNEIKVTLVINTPDGKPRRFMLDRAYFNDKEAAHAYCETAAYAWRRCLVQDSDIEVELSSRMVWYVRRDGSLG